MKGGQSEGRAWFWELGGFGAEAGERDAPYTVAAFVHEGDDGLHGGLLRRGGTNVVRAPVATLVGTSLVNLHKTRAFRYESESPRLRWDCIMT